MSASSRSNSRSTRSSRKQRKQSRRVTGRRAFFEALEQRSLLATWDGGGGDDNWMTAANWTGDTVPVAGDDLIFTGAVRLTPVNNFPAGTTFGSIQFDSSAGNFVVSGNSVTLNGGTDVVAATGTQQVVLPLTLSTTSTASVAGSTTLQISGVIDGAGGLTKDGAGTLNLSQANTFAGATTINAGSLQLSGGANRLPIGTNVTLANTAGATFDLNGQNQQVRWIAGGGSTGGSVTSAAAADLTINLLNAGTQTFSGAVGGAVRPIVQASTTKNTDVQVFAGTNTYTGGTVIDNGHLRVTNDSGLGAVPGALQSNNVTLLNAGVLQNNNSAPTLGPNRGILVGAGGGVIYVGWSQTMTVQGPISGQVLTKADNGTLQLTNTTNSQPSTLVTGGLLQGSDQTVGGAVTLNGGGMFNVAGSGGGAYFDADFGKTITVTGSGGIFRSGWGNTNISGQITGAGSFTVANDGVVLLSNTTNNYTGATVIGAAGSGTAATLRLGAANVIPNGTGTGNVSLSATSGGSATLDLNGFSEAVGGLTDNGVGTRTITSGIAGAVTLTFGDNNATTAFGGVVQNGSGTVAVSKSGAGEVQLMNTASTFSGGTTVTAGLLRATDLTLGAGGLTLNGGTLFNVAASGGGTYFDNNFGKTISLGASGGLIRSGWGDTTISGQITGAGALTIVNDGAVILTNPANDYGGNTILGAGGSGANATLRLGASNVIPNGAGKGNVTFNASSGGTALFDLNGFSETINGLSSGGAGTNTVNNTTGAGAVTLTVGDNNATSTYVGTIQNSAGSLRLVKTGSGEFLLQNGANTYTGGTEITGGLLRGSDSTLGAAAGSLTLNGGSLFNVAASGGGGAFNPTLARTVVLGAAGGGIRSGWGDTTITGQITGASGGAITIINDGAVTFTNPANDYAGNTVIGGAGSGNSATLRLGAAGVLPDGAGKGNLQLTPTAGGSATLNLNGFSETINGLADSGANTRTVTNGSATAVTLTLGGNDATATYAGVIQDGSGVVTLAKIGAGTQTLSGANTYTGLTTISAGTVLLGSATALGATAGSTTVASGAVLDLNGQTVGAEALNVSGTGIATNGALINSNATAASLAGDVTSAGGGYSVGGTGAITLTGNVQSNLTKVGGNTLTLGGTVDNGGLGVTVTSGTVILAKNPSTGGVHAVGGGGLFINGGTVQLAGTGGDQLFDGGPGVTVNAGGTFDVNGQTETIVGLNGAGTINNTAGTGAAGPRRSMHRARCGSSAAPTRG